MLPETVGTGLGQELRAFIYDFTIPQRHCSIVADLWERGVKDSDRILI